MKKNNDSLFRIGEVTKILGVTRKALLVYEDMGLLTPAVKDKDSGFRYYTADNMTQIRSIRSLQSLGLSLKDIKEYYYNTQSMDKHLERLLELRAILDKNIQMLQVRSIKPGDLTIQQIRLPHQICFCRRYPCRDIAEASARLRDTYIAAARTGEMSMTQQMFTMRMSPDPDRLDLMCCIPMEEHFDGPERTEFAEANALCIYHRGPYEKTTDAIRALTQYINANQIKTTGAFRSIYIEGAPNHGENTADYITQVAVPITEE